MKTFLLVASGLGIAYALAQLGRRAVAGELAGSFGDADASSVAASLSFNQAALAGLRALVGKSAYGYQGTIYVSPPN